GLALQCLADAGDMRGVNFPGTDKRAGPENLDGGIKFLPQRVEIAFRALAEKAVEYGVIRVIARADDQTPCFRALCNTGDDFKLLFGKARQIAAHVIEENGQIIDAERIKLCELAG